MIALASLSEYRDQANTRTNDVRLAIDHIRRAARVRGLSVEEVLQFLNTVHASAAPNQGIDKALESLLDVCIELEGDPDPVPADVREYAQFDRPIDRVTV